MIFRFLHNHHFFAVAQKRHAYIYDHNGTEIHKLDQMNTPTALDFLRHHFLLVSVVSVKNFFITLLNIYLNFINLE